MFLKGSFRIIPVGLTVELMGKKVRKISPQLISSQGNENNIVSTEHVHFDKDELKVKILETLNEENENENANEYENENENENGNENDN